MDENWNTNEMANIIITTENLRYLAVSCDAWNWSGSHLEFMARSSFGDIQTLSPELDLAKVNWEAVAASFRSK